MSTSSFDYSNRATEPPGRLVRWGSRWVRGVREVQAQVGPYADACEADNRLAVAAEGPLWVVLGDSMAQGIGAEAHDRGWPGQLRERVRALAGTRMVNLSVYGAGVDHVVRRQLPVLESLAAQSSEGRAALVTCVIGSNDLIGRERRAALPAALEALLERVPRGTVIATQPQGRPGTTDFNRRVDAAARRRGLRVADFRAPGSVDWRGKISRDFFHPNDAGYAAMADVMSGPVRDHLLEEHDPDLV